MLGQGRAGVLVTKCSIVAPNAGQIIQLNVPLKDAKYGPLRFERMNLAGSANLREVYSMITNICTCIDHNTIKSHMVPG